MKFEIYKDRGKEVRFRLVAGNGEIVAVSESYKRKRSAKQTIKAIIKALKGDVKIADLTKRSTKTAIPEPFKSREL